MFSSINRKVTKAWKQFIHPQDLESAFRISIIFFRLGGMFPYTMTNGQFKISYRNLGVTLAHISVYAYVNVNLLYVDTLAYAKPLIVDSSLAVVASIIIKSLGVILTLVIFTPILMGMKRFIGLLNMYNVLFDGLAVLGIEASHVYRKILFISGSATIVVFCLCLYGVVHSISFYEMLTDEEASLQFVYVVILSACYKNICLFALWTFLCANYLIIALLNEFLEHVLVMQEKLYEARQIRF